MAVTYTLRIDQLVVRAQVNNLSDVVERVEWTLIAVDGDRSTADIGATPIPLADGPITPFAELSNAQVVAWIEAADADTLAALRVQQAARLAIVEPPIEAKPPPWQPQEN